MQKFKIKEKITKAAQRLPKKLMYF